MAREFLMRITHDLRTPLTAIRGHAAALSDGIVPQEDIPRSLSAIEAETERLEIMVDDLLDLAKLDAHRFRLELDEVEDPRELLDAAFDAFESEAARQGVAYERVLGPLPPMVTDGQRVRQIVGNLLDNALRWTPEGGRVVLDAVPRAGGGLTVTVTDTGPGIPEAEREAIFEPFRSTRTPDGRHGSGLGLAISRQLARALGGDLWPRPARRAARASPCRSRPRPGTRRPPWSASDAVAGGSARAPDDESRPVGRLSVVRTLRPRATPAAGPSGLRRLLRMRGEDDVPALAGPDADRVLDGDDEDLAVPGLAGVRELEHGVDRPLHVGVVDDDLQLELGAQEDRRPGPAVALGVALLAAGALDLADAHGRQAHVRQAVADLVERLVPDERFDLLHDSLST